MSTIEEQVIQAADALIDAFGRHDRDTYFAAFAPQATFVFHHVAQDIPSRDAYEQMWRSWEEEDGFAVLGCESRNRVVQRLNDDTAVFTHSVRTIVSMQGNRETLDERETIVFVRTGQRWLAIHEHLSPLAAQSVELGATSC
jgi:ketosteroid isomerase-like protein